MAQIREGMQQGTTRVVNTNRNYGGKGKYIRVLNVENGCVQWLIFGLPQMQKPQGMGGGGGATSPMGKSSPFRAATWLICGVAAVERMLLHGPWSDYKMITDALKEALLGRGVTPDEIREQNRRITKALGVASGGQDPWEGGGGSVRFIGQFSNVQWFYDNFSFLYDKATWSEILAAQTDRRNR